MRRTLSLVLLLLTGCSEAFDPLGPYQQKIVVYSVLTSSSAVQYVRAYTTYNPAGMDPLSVRAETAVTGAQVLVFAGIQQFSFHDTILVRKDSSRYSSAMEAYVANGFTPQPLGIYMLNVKSPTLGEVRGTVTMPGAGSLALLNSGALASPGLVEAYDVQVSLGANVSAYIIRFTVGYTVKADSTWEDRFIEIPLSMREAGVSTGPEFTYPRPVFPTSHPSPLVPATEHVYFRSNAYVEVLSRLKRQFPAGALRFKAAKFTLVQMEQNLYAYYSVVNGFAGSVTLRLDEPDYTNIQGGFGVFGAMTQDDVSFSLPDDFLY